MSAFRLYSSRSVEHPLRLMALLVMAAALFLGACDGEDESTPVASSTSTAGATVEATSTATMASTAIEATDSSGEVFTLEGPAQRIVSHSPGVTEILFAIGAGAQIVAADEFSNFPAEADALPKVTYTAPDPEQSLSYEPDMVILTGNQEQSVQQFRDLDLPVFFHLEPDTIDGVLESVELFGRLTGHEAEATALVADMEARLQAVEDTLADVSEGPRVFWELDPTLYSVSPDTFIGGALSLLKAQNIAEGASSSYPQLTAEAVVEADPEVIFLADAAFGESAETVATRPGWDAVSAVVNDRVHGVDQDITSRPGPRIVDAVELLAALLYPDRFE